MQLSIDALQQVGAFTGLPVEREVSWKQGGKELTATVWVRPLGYSQAVAGLSAGRSGVDPVAARIASSICDQHGKPVFSAEDITGDAVPDRGPLDGNLTVALLAVIADVSGLGKAGS